MLTRRGFLKSAAVAGAAAAALYLIASRAAGSAPAGGKLNVAIIGPGGRGRTLIQELLLAGGNLVALCDVDSSQLDAARRHIAEKVPAGREVAEKAQVYGDYRRLLEASRSFDAVLIATGSRWHAPLCVAFMKAGKHIYCEKPLTHKIAEARELAGLAGTAKVATQTGTQGGSGMGFRRAVEIIQAGLLGQVRRVHLWCDGYGKTPPSHDRPAGEDPVPAGLNWDFWLGPAPLRPFKAGTYHPGCLRFQNWFDLCNGMLAGQGAHTFQLPVMALKLDHPVRVEAGIPEPVKETYVSCGSFRFEFPARAGLDPVTLWWTDGGKYPPEEVTEGLKAGGRKVPDMGCLFLGEKGELYAGGWGQGGMMRLKGEKAWRGVLDHEAAKPLPAVLPRVPGESHMAEWLAACKGGPATFSGFQTGARVVQAYLPGIVSLRLGRPIEWDGPHMKVTGAPEADALIRKTYRPKWLG